MNLRPGFLMDRTRYLICGGDLLCIALFSAAGAVQHPEGAPLLLRVPEIAAPFIGGWLAVGLFTGVFDARGVAGSRAAAGRAAVTWLGADLVGQGLRWTSIVPGGSDPAFFLVSLLVGGALLVGWRSLVARTVSG